VTADTQRFELYAIDIEAMIDSAFESASTEVEKENLSGLRPIVKARIKEKKRVRISTNIILRRLKKLRARIPDKSQVNPFHLSLFELIGAAKLPEAGRRIQRTIDRIGRVRDRTLSKLNRARSPSSMYRLRQQAYGEIASDCRSLKRVMEFIDRTIPKLGDLPTIKFQLPTVVIAGCPNVGKTTLLMALTGSRPEIKPIPFTTQRIQIGYYERSWQRIQVVDTPGLLDRPLEERNRVEMKAIEAMRHLADVLVFVVDPTDTSGFPIESQLNLLEGMRSSFDTPMITAVNKDDMADPEAVELAVKSVGGSGPVLRVSSTQGTGIAELRELIWSYLRDSEAN
jgi:nucleolar GTP-binding protein